MAATIGNVCVAVTLLMCVFGSQALDLLRATSTSGNPPATPRVHCWCPSYPNMTLCSWPEPSQTPPTHYVATYSERLKQQVIVHCDLIPPGSSSLSLIAASSSSSSSERVWHCLLPNLKLLTDYIINITAVHPAGSRSHLSSFMLEDVVKPNPPVDVRVSPLGVRNLMVEWSHPPAWANLHIVPLKYHILYQWENRGTPKSVNVNYTLSENELGPFENTTVELKGLTPGRPYVFQVCAKELLGLGTCSEWSTPVKITIPRLKL